mgnify:CR=1 FL=1
MYQLGQLIEQGFNIREPSKEQLKPLRELYHQKDWQQTIVRVQQLHDAYPASIALLSMKGASLIQLKRWEEAIACFKELISLIQQLK